MLRNVLVISCLIYAQIVGAQLVDVRIGNDVAVFSEMGDSILVYQIADKCSNDTLCRSNYVHPLFSLDGEVLTEDFPSDHLHHRGVFWAWHQLYIGEKAIGDGWEIKDFSWEVKSVKAVEQQSGAQSLEANVVWKSALWKNKEGNEKPFVSETTKITVYPKEKNFRKIDFVISILALEPNMRMGGADNEKGYGGFSYRLRLPGDVKFEGRDGQVIPQNTPLQSGGWLDMSGAYGRNGSQAGVAVLCHASNLGYPSPWILRTKRSMQNAVFPYPGAQTIFLSDRIPLVLRYRMVIHNDQLKAGDIDPLFMDYVGK
jgi:hypothetical protein